MKKGGEVEGRIKRAFPQTPKERELVKSQASTLPRGRKEAVHRRTGNGPGRGYTANKKSTSLNPKANPIGGRRPERRVRAVAITRDQIRLLSLKKSKIGLNKMQQRMNGGGGLRVLRICGRGGGRTGVVGGTSKRDCKALGEGE